MTKSVGFIGFGEAAEAFAAALRDAGVSQIVVYCDGRTNRPPYRRDFTDRVIASGATTVNSLREVVEESDVIFSAVIVATATEVGAQIAELLRPGQLLVDINASTPGSKKTIAEAVANGGAQFVDANLMGAVSIYGHAVQLYCSGSGAARFKADFEPLGFTVEVAGEHAGTAATVKMLRSVVTKGMEALIVEAMTAAYRANVTEEAFEGIVGPMDATSYRDFAIMCLKTDVLHAERRAVEMQGVADGLEEIGIEPTMANATVRRLTASAALGVRTHFVAQPPVTYHDVLRAYDTAQSSSATQS